MEENLIMTFTKFLTNIMSLLEYRQCMLRSDPIAAPSGGDTTYAPRR